MLSSLARRFARYVPPPRFMTLPAVGLDVGEDAVRFVEFKGAESTRRTLSRYAAMPLPKDVFTDGELTNSAALISVLQKIQAEYNLSYVHVSLPETKAYLYHTTVPMVKSREELASTVSFTLEENVPLSPSESVFDYTVISGGVGSETLAVAVSVYPQSTVDAYKSVLETSKLFVLSLELDLRAVARAAIKTDDSRTYLLLHIDERRTGIAIVVRGTVAYASSVAVGSATFTDAVAKHFSVSRDEAERIKRERGFQKERTNADLFNSLLSTVAVLRDEMVRRRDFWNGAASARREHHDPLAGIIITGSDADLPGFADFLGVTTGLPTRVANVWQNAFSLNEQVPDLPLQEALRFAPAIGLALTPHV